MNKKGKADEGGKKRTRRAQKFQKAIVGMSLDDIKKKKAQKPELRRAAEAAAAKEAAQRKKSAPKGKAAPKAGNKGKTDPKNAKKSEDAQSSKRQRSALSVYGRPFALLAISALVQDMRCED